MNNKYVAYVYHDLTNLNVWAYKCRYNNKIRETIYTSFAGGKKLHFKQVNLDIFKRLNRGIA